MYTIRQELGKRYRYRPCFSLLLSKAMLLDERGKKPFSQAGRMTGQKRDHSFPAERRNQKAQLEHRRSIRGKSSFHTKFIQAYFANQSTVHGSCDIDFLVLQQFRERYMFYTLFLYSLIHS